MNKAETVRGMVTFDDICPVFIKPPTLRLSTAKPRAGITMQTGTYK